MTNGKQLTLDSSLYDLNLVLIIGNCQINIRAFIMHNTQGLSAQFAQPQQISFVPSQDWTLSD